MEFPHLMNLVAQNQFDTIYHEHFSYFSFSTVRKIFTRGSSPEFFDVEEISTHGGSLRIYACHAGDASRRIDEPRGGHADTASRKLVCSISRTTAPTLNRSRKRSENFLNS